MYSIAAMQTIIMAYNIHIALYLEDNSKHFYTYIKSNQYKL